MASVLEDGPKVFGSKFEILRFVLSLIAIINTFKIFKKINVNILYNFQEAAFQTKFEEKPSFQTKFTDFTSELNSIDLENNQIRPAFSDLLPPKRVKSINHGNYFLLLKLI